MPSRSRLDEEGFLVSPGILFGLGLGGFFDGIVLHQILQWHHMLTSAGYPLDSVHSLEVNVMWDVLFHASTYIVTALGLWILWRYSRKNHLRWSGKLLPGGMLMGWGIFNLVEGIIDPPSARHPPRQRDGAARAVDLLGHRLLGLGRGHADRRLAPATSRTAQHRQIG
jgi:uncharacterized membrane protein